MKLYRACAYVIVDEDKLLAADRGFGPSEPITEGKPWVAVKSWLHKAKSAGERVPFIVWDAKNLNRWLGWGLLINLQIRTIDDDHRQTTFTFENLRPLGNHRRTDLHLLEQKRPISGEFPRSYARLETPPFLREAAMANGPLLSEWLCTADAVAHAFHCAYDDENRRREAELVLGRIVQLAKEAAHGHWGALVTPGRIRIIAGNTLIAQMGYDPELFFRPGPECEQEEDDPDMALSDLYAKYEQRFRVHIKNLAETRLGECTNAKVVEEYLANAGHPAKREQTRYDQTNLVLEYLQTRGCL